MALEKFSAEKMIAAIEETGGIRMDIARKLGCHRHTVQHYIDKYPTVSQAFEDEMEKMGDVAEALIIDDMVRNRSVETAKWYLAKKHRARGYGETVRQEITGTEENDGQIPIMIVAPGLLEQLKA